MTEIKELQSFKSDVERYFAGLREDVNKEIEIAQNVMKQHIEAMEKRVATPKVEKVDGVVIDYKTFSEIVNTLSYCVTQGVVTREVFDKVIEVAQKSDCVKKETVKPTQEAKKQKSELPEGIVIVGGTINDFLKHKQLLEEIARVAG